MNNFLLQHYKHKNLIHTVLLLSGMLVLLMVIGYLLAGFVGMFVTFLFGAATFFTVPRFSPKLILAMYQAQLLSLETAPGLYDMLLHLSREAGLRYVPKLYYLPSPLLNSFTLGEKAEASIVLSDGLLRSLDSREMFGVLAHEVSHLANNDIRVMSFADFISRFTAYMALFGYVLLVAYLPIYLFEGAVYPWALVVLLVLAPNLSSLMQLALSRSREFEADQKAVQLTGDALGLASALQKLESVQSNWFRQILIPNYKRSEPSVLRTHPSTHQRVERLMKIAEAEQHKRIEFGNHHPQFDSSTQIGKPRRRIHGLWY